MTQLQSDLRDAPLFNVEAVMISTLAVRTLVYDLTREQAEAFRDITVIRRGVQDEFYRIVPSKG
jgi:hypothetical protein